MKTINTFSLSESISNDNSLSNEQKTSLIKVSQYIKSIGNSQHTDINTDYMGGKTEEALLVHDDNGNLKIVYLLDVNGYRQYKNKKLG